MPGPVPAPRRLRLRLLIALAVLPACSPGAGTATVILVGDVMIAAGFDGPIRRGVDPFARLAPVFRRADLVFANLEGPLTDRGTRVEDKTYTFRTPPARIALLQHAGFAGFSLANNHMMDYGATGLADTVATLDRAGIAHAGAGVDLDAARSPAVFRVNGLPIALLGYNMTFPRSYRATGTRPGTAPADRDQMVADVTAARARGAQVIVMLHWGNELSDDAVPPQRELAAALVRAGACLIVGAHPHVPQGVERIGHAAVVYSLGDAVFGGHPLKSKDSLLARATLDAAGLVRLELLPLMVNREETRSQPGIRTDASAGPRLLHVAGLCYELGCALTRTRTAEGWPCLSLP